MRALSIRQPWAWLIVNGYKEIENRTWSTNYRGLVLIHTGKVLSEEDWFTAGALVNRISGVSEKIQKKGGLSIDTVKKQCGGIVGIAEIVDCVNQSNSPWFFGPYGLVLKNAKPLPFHPCKGRLGIFEVENYIMEAVLNV